MHNSKILSTEEVEALLKVSQEKGLDLTKLTSQGDSVKGFDLSHIAEFIRAECEDIFSSFLRKKVTMTIKASRRAKLSDYFSDAKSEKHVFVVFRILPEDCYGMVAIELNMLHQAINLLFGGHIDAAEKIIDTPGKVGMIVADKIGHLVLDAFRLACQEYGTIMCELVKTVTLPGLTSKLSADDLVYGIEMPMALGTDINSTVTVLIHEKFFDNFIPTSTEEGEDGINKETEFWQSTIKKQVVNSDITLSVTLPEMRMRVSELVSLKNGDLIPIGDPTHVVISLNDTKLFHGYAGQANSKRVAKILGEA